MTCGDGPGLSSMTERCSSNLCLRCFGFFFFFPPPPTLSNKQKVDGNDNSAAKMAAVCLREERLWLFQDFLQESTMQGCGRTSLKVVV